MKSNNRNKEPQAHGYREQIGGCWGRRVWEKWVKGIKDKKEKKARKKRKHIGNYTILKMEM